MKGQTSSTDLDHKRYFLAVFRRWESLFKRADRGDLQAEKWFIAEYYKSLSHLSPAGLEALTDLLKEKCIFFPTISECLAAIKPRDQYDWGHPFNSRPAKLFNVANRPELAAPQRQIGHSDG